MSENEKSRSTNVDRQTLPIGLNALDTVKELLSEAVGDTPFFKRVLLACDEWITNVTLYSGSSEFMYSMKQEGSMLAMIFSDNGIPFDPVAERKEMPDLDDLDMGGMGLGFIRESADEMEYSRTDGRNILTMRFIPKEGELERK